MLIKTITIPKDELVTVTENTCIKDALQLLEKHNFKCLPVLNSNKQLFRGNIYLISIYQYMLNDGDLDAPVTFLLKNATKYIHLNDSFFKIFFNINELPYLAVLDNQQQFYGILTHKNLLTMLSQNWNLTNGGFVFTIESSNDQGQLALITKIFAKYTDVLNCITLDFAPTDKVRETLVTVPRTLTIKQRNKIIHALDRHDLKLLKIENLTV